MLNVAHTACQGSTAAGQARAYRDPLELGSVRFSAGQSGGGRGFRVSGGKTAAVARGDGPRNVECGQNYPLSRPRSPLSPREREVLELIGAGATNREIAERLFLSPHTIKDHTTALYRKLGVRNRAEAARKAEQLGLTRGV